MGFERMGRRGVGPSLIEMFRCDPDIRPKLNQMIAFLEVIHKLPRPRLLINLHR